MRFPSPLVRGRLKQRYKRFLADIVLDTGEHITAACPNTGAMVGLAAPGSVVWLSKSDAATRKYPHTWELVEADLGNGATLVGINPMQPNRLIAEAIAAGGIKKLSGYETLRREVKYGEASRIDLLLEDARKGRCYVEVKNVHLMRADAAEFPDCVTARGAKHLRELTAMVAAGHRAEPCSTSCSGPTAAAFPSPMTSMRLTRRRSSRRWLPASRRSLTAAA